MARTPDESEDARAQRAGRPGTRVAGHATATTKPSAAPTGLRAITSMPMTDVKPKIASRTTVCMKGKSMRSNGS